MNKRELFMKLLNEVDTALSQAPTGKEESVLDNVLVKYSISYLED